MRIVHTSDWHAGRIWKGKDRLGELENVLDHLAQFIEREKIELLLVSGDIFDHHAPSAEAERAVFRFFKRVGMSGAHSVVIAGNHDSPARLEAWSQLAELVQVHAVAKPRSADRGGVIELDTKNGERAVIAALPFAAPKVMMEALQLAQEETIARQLYADTLARMIAVLCDRHRADTVNLLVAHTHLDGAIKSGSERKVHLGSEWAGTRERLPSSAQYVALGHIHKPQAIEAGAPALYAGSPMQLDFGELGEAKSFVVIDARAGRPANLERVPYEGALPLGEIRGTLEDLERDGPALIDRGWLRVRVPVPMNDPDLAAKVRRILPNAVVIEPELPVSETPENGASPGRDLEPRMLFSEYFRKTHAFDPAVELLDAFDHLRNDDASADA